MIQPQTRLMGGHSEGKEQISKRVGPEGSQTSWESCPKGKILHTTFQPLNLFRKYKLLNISSFWERYNFYFLHQYLLQIWRPV